MLDPKFVRRGLFLVFIILFLDIIGIAIIMPVLPAYLEQLTGGGISDAAVDGGWLMLVYAGMQFLFAPLLGGLFLPRGGRWAALTSMLVGITTLLVVRLATHNLGYGWASPTAFGLLASGVAYLVLAIF